MATYQPQHHGGQAEVGQLACGRDIYGARSQCVRSGGQYQGDLCMRRRATYSTITQCDPFDYGKQVLFIYVKRFSMT